MKKWLVPLIVIAIIGFGIYQWAVGINNTSVELEANGLDANTFTDADCPSSNSAPNVPVKAKDTCSKSSSPVYFLSCVTRTSPSCPVFPLTLRR